MSMRPKAHATWHCSAEASPNKAYPFTSSASSSRIVRLNPTRLETPPSVGSHNRQSQRVVFYCHLFSCPSLTCSTTDTKRRSVALRPLGSAEKKKRVRRLEHNHPSIHPMSIVADTLPQKGARHQKHVLSYLPLLRPNRAT